MPISHLLLCSNLRRPFVSIGSIGASNKLIKTKSLLFYNVKEEYDFYLLNLQ